MWQPKQPGVRTFLRGGPSPLPQQWEVGSSATASPSSCGRPWTGAGGSVPPSRPTGAKFNPRVRAHAVATPGSGCPRGGCYCCRASWAGATCDLTRAAPGA